MSKGEKSNSPRHRGSLDINSSSFDPSKYVNSLIQRKGLDELVAVEEDMIMNVRRLDSEMQQLYATSSIVVLPGAGDVSRVSGSTKITQNFSRLLARLRPCKTPSPMTASGDCL